MSLDISPVSHWTSSPLGKSFFFFRFQGFLGPSFSSSILVVSLMVALLYWPPVFRGRAQTRAAQGYLLLVHTRLKPQERYHKGGQGKKAAASPWHTRSGFSASPHLCVAYSPTCPEEGLI